MKKIYLVNILSIIAIIIFFFSNKIIKNDTYEIIKNVLSMMALFTLLYINSYYFKNAWDNIYFFLSEYGLLLIVILTTVFVLTNLTTLMISGSILKNIINVAIYGGGLYMLYFLYVYVSNNSLSIGLNENFLNNIQTKILYFFKSLKSYDGVLLLIETLLISSYFLIPYVVNKLSNSDAYVLLGDKPIYLNKESVVGTYENLHNNNNDKHIYNYTLSCCFYINPQYSVVKTEDNNYVNIINYGNKPVVQYDFINNTLMIKSINNNSNENIILKKLNVPLQKWNNLVVQYNNGIVDIFMNGDIVVSKKNQIPFMKYDKVVVGNENGLEGGIKNVKYYARNLRLDEIKSKAMYCN